MILELVGEEDKILKKSCPIFDFQNSTVDPVDLATSMFDLMYRYEGIGLACPQVGLNHRMFVIGVDDAKMVCYNPEIINEYGDIQIFNEGCLSFPDLFMKVKRYESALVRYQDETGVSHEKDLTGILARCFLHELDHVNGLVFLDRVGQITLQMAKKRRQKQRNKTL